MATQARMATSFTHPPPRDVLMKMASKQNNIALPVIPNRYGVLLPFPRFCLTAPRYHVEAAATSGDSAGNQKNNSI
jgi:transcription initiation factor TFIID subunit 9B